MRLQLEAQRNEINEYRHRLGLPLVAPPPPPPPHQPLTMSATSVMAPPRQQLGAASSRLSSSGKTIPMPSTAGLSGGLRSATTGGGAGGLPSQDATGMAPASGGGLGLLVQGEEWEMEKDDR